jgi:uncharacterized membrane protein YfcA
MVFWIIATRCAFFVKGLCGFANTLVFTPILSFGTDNINISPVELILGFPSNLIITIKERKSINLKICIPLSLLVLAGSLLGVFLLKNADASLVKAVCGAVIVLVGIEMLLRELLNKKTGGSKILLLLIGVVSGILCGMYGIGALLGAYLGRVTEDTRAFKANICMVFIVENTFRLFLYGIYGIITLEALKKAAILIPFMLVGLGLGMFSARFIDERVAKKIVVMLLIVSGIALFIGNI